jgi:hypothetical protein
MGKFQGNRLKLLTVVGRQLGAASIDVLQVCGRAEAIDGTKNTPEDRLVISIRDL